MNLQLVPLPPRRPDRVAWLEVVVLVAALVTAALLLWFSI